MSDLVTIEAVLQAFEQALKAQAAAGVLPEVMRNEPLMVRMVTFRGLQCFLNLVDGGGGPSDIELGAGRGGGVYAIEWRPRVEWVVLGPDKALRRTVLSDGMRAIHAALRDLVDRDPPVIADGEVESCDFSDHAVAGLADINGVEMSLLLSFDSDQPF